MIGSGLGPIHVEVSLKGPIQRNPTYLKACKVRIGRIGPLEAIYYKISF